MAFFLGSEHDARIEADGVATFDFEAEEGRPKTLMVIRILFTMEIDSICEWLLN